MSDVWIADFKCWRPSGKRDGPRVDGEYTVVIARVRDHAPAFGAAFLGSTVQIGIRANDAAAAKARVEKHFERQLTDWRPLEVK